MHAFAEQFIERARLSVPFEHSAAAGASDPSVPATAAHLILGHAHRQSDQRGGPAAAAGAAQASRANQVGQIDRVVAAYHGVTSR